MKRGQRHPPERIFDHNPSDAELLQVVGPDYTATRLIVREDDESIVVQSPRFPFWRSLLLVLLMCSTMSVWPWLLEWLFAKPVTIETNTLIAILGFLWLAVVPLAYLLLARARRKAAARLPAVVVAKQLRELQLPWLPRVVSLDQIECFVDVRARRRLPQHIAFYRQCGVILRDGEHFHYVGFARLTAPSLRKSAAVRLADYCDRPVRVLNAGML